MELIITGCILIALQLIGDVGSLFAGGLNYFTNVISFDVFLYELINFTAYSSIGILGVVFHIIGIKSYRKGGNATIILHKTDKKRYTVLSYIFAVLLGLTCLGYVEMICRDGFSQSGTFQLISLLFLLIYLLFYRNKKPTLLFSVALLLAGISYIYGLFISLPNLILLSGTSWYYRYLVFSILPILATSIVYIIIAIMLYMEKFSTSCIKILGAIAFSLMMLKIFYGKGVFCIDLGEIILPLTIFIYTCIVPINAPTKTNKKGIEKCQ